MSKVGGGSEERANFSALTCSLSPLILKNFVPLFYSIFYEIARNIFSWRGIIAKFVRVVSVSMFG